jgi:hypothetical protein
MLENVGKLLDVVEDLLSKEDATDPAKSDQLVAIVERLETLAMEVKDRTET